MPSEERPGKVGKYFDLPADVYEQFQEFSRRRGIHSSLRDEIVEAMRRHMAYPPALAPLGDSPAAKPSRPRKAKG